MSDLSKCLKCGYPANSPRGLSQHIRQAHPDMSLKDYYDAYLKKEGEGVCTVCGNPTNFSGKLSIGYYTHCSNKCTAKDKNTVAKRKATSDEKYGDPNYNNHEQTSKTKSERYDDPNYSNTAQIKATKLKRHGSPGYNNTAKREQTKKERYDDPNFVNPEKASRTKEERYDDPNYNNSKQMARTKATKYGNPSFVNPDKARQTVNKKTVAKYSKVLSDQCDVISYDNNTFHCKCKKCGNIFDIPITTGYMRLYRYGTGWCTVCNPPETSRSNEEDALFDYVCSLVGTENVKKSVRDVVPHAELDIYIPEKSLAIEFDGLYWHDERRKGSDYHVNKTSLCEKHNIKLIHVFEDEWQFKTDIVKSRIKSLLGSNEKIYARKCSVGKLSFADAKDFLEKNHIQGYCISKWNYALAHNGSTVALMSFGQNRFGDGVELLRFCCAKYVNVVGAASKLFKHFIREHQEVNEIVSFADRRWSSSDAFYPKLGFKFDGISRPSYFYVINGVRHNRMEFTKAKLVKAGFDKSMSEHEIMLSRGIYRIFDCGNFRFVWKR